MLPKEACAIAFWCRNAKMKVAYKAARLRMIIFHGVINFRAEINTVMRQIAVKSLTRYFQFCR